MAHSCNFRTTDPKDVLFHFKDIDVQLVDRTYNTELNPYKIQIRRKVLDGITKSWIDEVMSPCSLFIHLGLNTDKGNLFEKPCFESWLRYVEKYNAKQKNSWKRKIDPDVFPATPEIDFNSFPTVLEIDLNTFPVTPDVNSSPATTALSMILNSLGFKTYRLADLYCAANSEKKLTLTNNFKAQFGRALDNLDSEGYKSLIETVVRESYFERLQEQNLKKLDEGGTSTKKRKTVS